MGLISRILRCSALFSLFSPALSPCPLARIDSAPPLVPWAARSGCHASCNAVGRFLTSLSFAERRLVTQRHSCHVSEPGSCHISKRDSCRVSERHRSGRGDKRNGSSSGSRRGRGGRVLQAVRVPVAGADGLYRQRQGGDAAGGGRRQRAAVGLPGLSPVAVRVHHQAGVLPQPRPHPVRLDEDTRLRPRHLTLLKSFGLFVPCLRL